MQTPSFVLEDQQGGYVAGCDEAGCGPWAGPVVAGAVILMRDHICADLLHLLNDSKRLTSKKRDVAFDALMASRDKSCWIGVGSASVAEIDQINIRKAAHLAMQRAVEDLMVPPQFVLVDGTGLPAWGYASKCVVKGDQKSYSIAAASIIAKVVRDRHMQNLAKLYPAYGWERNAGYGTKVHQDAIAHHGITPHHRRSFAPIKNYLALSA